MDKSCETCKYISGASSACTGCGLNKPANWEPKEVMDIWKKAPESATHYDPSSDEFMKIENNQWIAWIKGEWERVIPVGEIRSKIIKRPQAEQEGPKEWKDGLPPIGYTHKEVEKPVGWHENDFKVVAHVDGLIDEDGDEFCAAILCSNNGVVKPFLADELKPLKSQAEKEREEAIDDLEEFLQVNTTLYENSCHDIAEIMVNADYRKRLANKGE